LPFFLLAAAILYAIWARHPQVRVKTLGSSSNDQDLALTGSDKAGSGGNQSRQDSAQATPVTVDVVIPVLNEAHVLEKSVGIVREFLSQSLSHRWRVVIVDNGSTDGTDKVASRLKERFPDVEFLQLLQRGRGRALRYAWMQSKADVVSYMDVDLSTNLAHLPQMIDAIVQEGYDIAIGSRLMDGAQTRRSIKREMISRVYNIFVKAVLFTRFSDAQCGFKAVSRKVVDQVVPQIEDQTWFFDTELLVLAEKQGYRTKDIPVVWTEDDDSRVKIVRTAWDDIKGVLRLRKQLWMASFANAPATRVKREKT
jgi:glycosyltransferase involved in cell wall biosynthesis